MTATIVKIRRSPAGGLLGWAILIGVMAGWLLPMHRETAPVAAESRPATTLHFDLCRHGDGADCVVDGDTFHMAGDKIRIADIDTPETHPPRCTAEAALGEQATLRLQELLNAGSFALAPIDRDRDRYGRRLRIVERDGRSIGEILIAEGLARPYAGGHRAGWCGVAV